MVIVGDDVAIPGAPRLRGLAGTLLVHKVAGHLARAGASLAEVRAGAERAARAALDLRLECCQRVGATWQIQPTLCSSP